MLQLVLFCLLLFPITAAAQVGSMTIYNTSGGTITNRPIAFGRPFKESDIADCAHARVNGTPVTTQCNAMTRWTDGSLNHAVIAFVIPTIPSGGSVTVDFVNDEICNDTGGLTKAQMLDAAYDFEGTIQLTGASVQTFSARSMLNAATSCTGDANTFSSKCRYWLRGPIVTAVILEDRTLARSFDKDFGDGSKALHPIFEAWFFPQGNKVEMSYTIENIWGSSTEINSMRDLTYSLALTSGSASPTTEFTHVSMNHIGKSRWHKRFWLGTDPPAVRVDHNLSYLVQTRAIPNYDTSITIAPSTITASYNEWLADDKTLDGDATTLGTFAKGLGQAGGSPWIGLNTKWDVFYLYTMGLDDRMKEWAFGNNELAGRINVHLREADTLAGTGDWFDQPYDTNHVKVGTGTVDTFGRIVSIYARKTHSNFDFTQLCAPSSVNLPDLYDLGVVTNDGWPNGGAPLSHYPEVPSVPYMLTGLYYYLEEVHFWGGWVAANKTGCIGGDFFRQADWGLIHYTNIRGDAWGLRALAMAQWFTPDGWPEKAYFDKSIRNNISEWEGVLNLPLTDLTRQHMWNFGRNSRAGNTVILGPERDVSPLGQLYRGSPAFIDDAFVRDTIAEAASEPWMENYFIVALGRARQFGYEPDNILKFMARWRFHTILDPAAWTGNPPTVPMGPYPIEVYVNMTHMLSTGTWAQTFPESLTGYTLPPAPRSPHMGWLPAALSPADSSRNFEALSANAYLADFTVDGYNGLEVFNAHKAIAPYLTTFSTQSPKWSILPFNPSAPPEPPPTLTIIEGSASLSGGGVLQ